MQPMLPSDPESAAAGHWSSSHPRKGVTIDRLKMARHFFKLNPHGKLRTGLPSDPEWTREEYRAWFLRCLHAKINRGSARDSRKLSPEYQGNLRRDAQIIRDAARRIRRSGRNILSTPEMRRRYPHINNYTPEV